ncbi:3,4-dihydroxy-2-butanone-4-phosphate synthase [Imhoffiella purpurea]|uniref:3,4-dihydroxy-2-butanone 4-phosphate synthase n=1 Tax=Imhoffiella purpurea TaxID=1249627 RepID=W9VHM3_9GAMM|nr:3,4-dihydroxy-2-butanone-4-phosphate synthase [Imhoffiella purpurea]EXJ16501.1 3,4-dihydroxy-2-butanone 4-phosphate synthase [Imhoffiella purpurea]
MNQIESSQTQAGQNQTSQNRLDPTLSIDLLSRFGSPQERVQTAIDNLRQGGGILLVDDEDRENEGDLIFPAHTITQKQMALLIRECSGIVCLCLEEERLRQLGLPMMVEQNTSRNGTAFTVSIEARQGVTTGVSAADRVTTIRAAIAEDACPDDLSRPGHVFPLRARPGGVLARRGHTEGTVDLMTLAGFGPAGVLCELTNADGTMARLPEIVDFAERHGMPVLTIEDLVAYRQGLLGQCSVVKETQAAANADVCVTLETTEMCQAV